MEEPGQDLKAEAALVRLGRLAVKLHQRGLCPPCLGRMVAKLGYGLTNAQRGEALLISLAMARELDENPPDWLAKALLPYLHHEPTDEGSKEQTDKPPSCTLCQGLFDQLDGLVEQAGEAVEGFEAETFAVGSIIEERQSAAQGELVQQLKIENAEPFKQHLNRELSNRLISLTGLTPDLERPHLNILFDTRYDIVKVSSNSLFIKGRYRKLVRGLPQTHWPCRECRGLGCFKCQGSGYQYPSSVEQLVATPLKQASRAEGERFHGAGREDIDVRCLGSGRPFIVELIQPRQRFLDLDELAELINSEAEGQVEVEQLAWVNRKEIARIKEAPNDKSYRAQVEFESPVAEESLKKALELLAAQTISQRTPSRVAHRRADKVRKRHLRSFKVVNFTGESCTLELVCEHGTYVKELIHGDEARTEPNLAALLDTPCRVAALDVLAVFDRENPQTR